MYCDRRFEIGQIRREGRKGGAREYKGGPGQDDTRKRMPGEERRVGRSELGREEEWRGWMAVIVL